MIYQSYINGSRWRNNPARLAALQGAGFRCRICNASQDDVKLEVHHRTYERLGCERVDDLTTLCRDCHYVVTDMLRRRRYVLHRPRSTDVIPAIEDASPLFDPMAKE